MAAYFPGAGSYVVARTAADPSIPVYEIRTMQDRMSDSLARQRFSAIMLGAFSLFAPILAAAGIVVGLIGALALTRVMATLLFGIGATRDQP